MLTCTGNKYLFIITFFLSYLTRSVWGQESIPYFRHYTTENGLPSSEVYSIVEDKKGNVWFGTDRGVARFDGYEFKTFTYLDGLTDNTVFNLQEDNFGRIWMLSFSCRLYYYENGKVHAYNNNLLLKESQGRIPTSFYVDSMENVYTSVHSFGIIKIDSSGNFNWKHNLSHLGSINYIIDEQTPNNALLAYTYNKEIQHAKYIHTWNNLTDTFSISDSGKDRFTAIRLTTDKLIFSSGKLLYERTNNSIKLIADLPGKVITLSKDRNQNLWAGTESGAFQIDVTNSTIISNYLVENSITGILQDREGGYWFTTLDKGVFYMPGYGIQGIPFNEGPFQKPISLVSDKKSNIYAGCWNGMLVKIHAAKKEIMYIPGKPDYNSMIFNLTYFDDERLLLSRSNPGFIKNKKYYPIYNKNVFGIKTELVKDSNEIYYAAGTTFFFIIRNDSVIENIFLGQRINCLIRDSQKRILLGCSRGVFVFNLISKSLSPLHKDLTDLRIDDIKMYNDKIVMASKGKGLLILDGDRIQTIDESNGLCSNLVNKILIRENQIWCTTNKGISKIEFQKNNPAGYKITNVNSGDGLFSDEITGITELNDTIYAASNSGISFFNSRTDFTNFTNPPVAIKFFKINNSDTAIGENITLKYNQNNFHIEFTGISFRSSGKIKYHYQLICGKDTTHSIISGRSVEFLSLNPGKYNFSVSAINNSGFYSKIPATISFEILPAWWQSLWFRIIIAALISVFIYLLYRNKLKQLKQQFEAERKQASLQLTAMRAQMNPHFIFNVMNSIRNYMQNHDLESAEKYLTSFSKLVRYTLDNSEVQEISLEEELEAIKNYIAHEKLRFENGFEFDILIEEGIDPSDITLLSMLLQPYVENAIKHGISRMNTGGKIVIAVREVNGKVIIAIEDNGVGTTESQKWNSSNRANHISHGTSLNSERIIAYNKVFNKNIKVHITNLTSGNGNPSGTRVEVEL
jgi:sensor histidine kinase YesM/ligand-binding sensor domain-containing protein